MILTVLTSDIYYILFVDISLDRLPSASKSRTPHENVAQFEERLHTLNKHKIGK